MTDCGEKQRGGGLCGAQVVLRGQQRCAPLVSGSGPPRRLHPLVATG